MSLSVIYNMLAINKKRSHKVVPVTKDIIVAIATLEGLINPPFRSGHSATL